MFQLDICFIDTECYRVRQWVWVAISVLLLLLFGCGDQRIVGLVGEGVIEAVDLETSLMRRAQEANAALSSGDWNRYYSYQSPRVRSRRWPYGLELIQSCSPNKFAVAMEEAVTEIRGNLGIGVDEPMSWVTSGLQVDRDNALVFVDIIYMDEVVDYAEDDGGLRWIFVDGEWWREDYNWSDDCPDLRSTVEEG